MKIRAILFIIIAGLLWGSSGIFVHFLSACGFTPVQMTALRGLVSLFCMAGFILAYDKRLFLIKKSDALISVIAGVSLFFTATFYYEAMTRIGIAPAVVIMYASPVLVMLASSVMFKESMFALKWIALIVMIAGCFLSSGIVSGIDWSFSKGSSLEFNLKIDATGLIFAVSSAFTYAIYNLATKLLVKKGCPSTSVTLYVFLSVAVLGVALCSPVEAVKTFAENPLITIPLAIALGVVTFVLPYFLYTLGMKKVSAGTASALAVVEPVSASVFGLFLSQTISPIIALGITLAVIAVLLLCKAENTPILSSKE